MAVKIDDKTMVKMSHSAALRALAASQRALSKAMGELTAAREAMQLIVNALESTRWMGGGPIREWVQTPEGHNHASVMIALEAARKELSR